MAGTEAFNLDLDAYRKIFDQHPLVMLVVNPRDYSIVHANLAALHFYGWSLEQLKTKKLPDINQSHPKTVFAETLLAKDSTHSYFQFRHTLANGGIRDVEVQSIPVSWQNQSCLCFMVTDVTERIRSAQEVLKKNQQLQRANAELLRQSEIQAVLKAIAEASILASSLNDLYEMVHGIVRRVLPAENFYISFRDEATDDIVRPYTAGEANLVPKRRPQGRGLTEYVLRLGRALYTSRPMRDELAVSGEVDIAIANCNEWLGAPLIDPQGDSFGILAMFSTESVQNFQPEDESVLSIIAAQISQAIQRKRTEETLAESEARYRALMEQSNEAVIICDPDTGEIIEANSRFTERFGYQTGGVRPLYIYDLTTDSYENNVAFLARAKQEGYLPLERRVLRHRNGTHVQVERSANLVRYRNHSLLVQTLRDVSDVVRYEQRLRREAELATRVQNALLKQAKPNDYLDIATIYEPHSYVGGDLYFMDWRYEGSLLRGYLLDATGHGVATALHTSALHVLLREVNDLDLPLSEQMRWLNRRTGQYFANEAFAGALGFELDLQTQQLKWSCAGIPAVWLATDERRGIAAFPGMYLGICSNESFEVHTLALKEGDAVCFMTDGLSESLERIRELPEDYESMVRCLRQTALELVSRDDATGICLRVKAWPHSSFRRDAWPHILNFNGYGDYQRLKGEVGRILAEVTGRQHSIQEVAVHEALVNAMECRDGVHRSYRASLKLNLVGQCLIARVKTSRIGFAGNVVLRRLRANPAEIFSFGEEASMGRGIPIMLATTHRMMYNSEGTELLLAWKLNSRAEIAV